jgi:hypothetical protein
VQNALLSTLPSIASVYPLKLCFPIFLVGTEISFPFCIRLNGVKVAIREWFLLHLSGKFFSSFYDPLNKIILGKCPVVGRDQFLDWQLHPLSLMQKGNNRNHSRIATLALTMIDKNREMEKSRESRYS